MNAIAVSDAPAVDTFGGLRRETETPEQALRRLERKSNYVKVIGSDEGQRLLAAATAQVAAARNGVVPRPAAVAPDDRIGELKCNDGNHVPGHTAGCPRYVEPAAAAPAETAAPAPSRGSSVAAQLMDVPLDLVDIGENVRTDPGDLEGLAASIEDIGVQQPIVAVGPGADGRYRAVNGQRRILATRVAKRSTIPAVVYASSDLDLPGNRRSLAQLAENLQRKEMNKIEEALALRAVLDGEKGLTQAALAKKIGISEPTLSSTLALLRAPAAVQELVRSETLSIGHAKALAGLPAAHQVRLAKSAAENGVSAHALEDTAKYERQRLAHVEQRKAAARAKADHAIALLAKVASVESATIGFADSGGSSGVKELLIEAGWTVIDGWSVTKLDNAGSCGCKGVWRIDNPYGEKDLPKLYPGCKVPSHQDARRVAVNKEAEAERARAAAAREAERAVAKERQERVVAFLTDTLGSALSLRATVYALLIEDSSSTDLVDRYLTPEEQEGDQHGDRDFDALWAAIERVPAEDLPRELALAVAATLGAAWDGADAPLSAIDEAMSEAPGAAVDDQATPAAEPLVWRSLRKSPHGGYTLSHLFPASMQIAWDRRVVGVAACGFDPFAPQPSGGFDMQIDREGSTLKAVQKLCAKCVAAEAVPAGGQVDVDAIAEAAAP